MTHMPAPLQFQLAQKLPRDDVTLDVQVKTPGSEFQTLNRFTGSFSDQPKMISKANRAALRWSLSGVFHEAEFRILRVNNPQ